MNIEKILEKMTLEEKIALCSGADFWHTKEMSHRGIPSMMMSDGPHGLRKQPETADMLGINESVPATSFPTAVLSACSWDKELLKKEGEAIAREAIANKVSLVLGPGANIKRNPLCGRNFEYFSEDPYLSGKMAAAHISGIEKTGCGSSLKHFALNNQEYKRFSSDSLVDERTMREIYLASFETAVKEGHPSTVMCSYNKINGTYSSDNRWLLTEVLRDEWGFDGLVVTDWGAMSDRIKGFLAGCDLMMPGGSDYMEKECAEAVKNGTLSEEDVTRSARRVLELIAKTAHETNLWHLHPCNHKPTHLYFSHSPESCKSITTLSYFSTSAMSINSPASAESIIFSLSSRNCSFSVLFSIIHLSFLDPQGHIDGNQHHKLCDLQKIVFHDHTSLTHIPYFCNISFRLMTKI